MKFGTAAAYIVLTTTTPLISEAFSVIKQGRRGLTTTTKTGLSFTSLAPKAAINNQPTTLLWYANDEQQTTAENIEIIPKKSPAANAGVEPAESDVVKLRAMAAKYRAEATTLEAERADELATQAQKAFENFDMDRDGEISVQELKGGLEKQLKTDLTDDKVMKLMAKFDASGDGKLQLQEFVEINRFRNALEDFAREERRNAQEKKRKAQLEEEASQMLEQQLEGINDSPPTATEKVVSVLPYLLPLLDSLPYASNLILNHPDNPVAQALATMYSVYQSVPLGGFIAYFALTTLSGNLRINRLIRYNMLQAVYTDIALFFPGVLAAVVGLIANATNQEVPADLVATTSNAIFFTMLVALSYNVGSSLLGQEPNDLPIISERTNSRMPPSKDALRDAIEKTLPWKQQQNEGEEKNQKDDNGL